MSDRTKWTNDWPTEPGWYWLYGWDFGEDGEGPTLIPVKVHKIANGHMHVASGNFIFPAEAVGVWAPIEMPEVPKC